MAWNKVRFIDVGVSAWVCPPGVKEVILFGYGGGGGGGGGSSSSAFFVDEAPQGGGGGAGSTPVWTHVPVTPGSSYDVKVGDGGAGGAGAATPGNDGVVGSNGESTSFDYGGGDQRDFPFGGKGLGGLRNGSNSVISYTCGGRSFFEGLILEIADLRKPNQPGDGGCGSSAVSIVQTQWGSGRMCPGGGGYGGLHGDRGADFGSVTRGGGPGGGGGGGHGGGGAIGGDGSNASGTGVLLPGFPGGVAAVLSGAGGGGGGASGQGYPALAGGAGGKGGSGMLVIYWWS